MGRAVFPPDFEAEFLNTTAYLENALVLEYLFILVLSISEEKRSAHCLACATEVVPIFTFGLLTFFCRWLVEGYNSGCKIGLSTVAHARRCAERFSSDTERTRIKNSQAQARSLGKPWR